MCSGRIDPQFLLAAFREGADGVLIGGCHPGDCHYQEGNYKCLRRFALLKRVTKALGIEPERLRLEWISASEGDKVQRVINEMTAQVRRLGPLGWKRMPAPGRESALPAGPSETGTDRSRAAGSTSNTVTAGPQVTALASPDVSAAGGVAGGGGK